MLKYDFRCGVFRHSRDREDVFLSSFNFFGESEIGEFDVAFVVDHDVFRFEVSIDDIFAVHVVKGKNDLRNVELSSV